MAKNTIQLFKTIENSKLNEVIYILRAIAHPLRLKIISFIDKNNSVHVNKIYSSLNLEQSITSQHLKILRNAKLVNTIRKGKFIYYNLNYKNIIGINSVLEKYKIK
jgi:DNA-binding transcriptional ArsR family regulator